MILQFKTSIPPTSNQRLMPVVMGNKARLVKSPDYRKWMENTVQDISLQARAISTSYRAVCQTLNEAKQDALNNQYLGAAEIFADMTKAVKGGDSYTLTDELYIVVAVCPPDKRKRDVDNVLKPINDALVQARVIEDDSKIVMEMALKLPPDRKNKRHGEVQVFIFDKSEAAFFAEGLGLIASPESEALDQAVPSLIARLNNEASPYQRALALLDLITTPYFNYESMAADMGTAFNDYMADKHAPLSQAEREAVTSFRQEFESITNNKEKSV